MSEFEGGCTCTREGMDRRYVSGCPIHSVSLFHARKDAMAIPRKPPASGLTPIEELRRVWATSASWAAMNLYEGPLKALSDAIDGVLAEPADRMTRAEREACACLEATCGTNSVSELRWSSGTEWIGLAECAEALRKERRPRRTLEDVEREILTCSCNDALSEGERSSQLTALREERRHLLKQTRNI